MCQPFIFEPIAQDIFTLHALHNYAILFKTRFEYELLFLLILGCIQRTSPPLVEKTYLQHQQNVVRRKVLNMLNYLNAIVK